MALLLKKPTSFGVDAEYWMIANIAINKMQRSADVTLACYLNQAAREAGKTPLNAQRIVLQGAEFDIDLAGNIPAQLYAKIKAKPDFATATDV